MNDLPHANKNAEKIYDEQISPLMEKIIDICKTHRIPMVASFQYLTSEDGDIDFCTTRIPFTNESPKFQKIVDLLFESPYTFGMTITQPVNKDKQ